MKSNMSRKSDVHVVLPDGSIHPLRDYLVPTAILMLAALILMVSMFLPYWSMKMFAPQYPKGLMLEHIPHIQDVLNETARLLKPGARFVFCVPNEEFTRQLSIARFLGRLGLRWLGDAYRRLFNRVSRHLHCDAPATWEARLRTAGFEIDQHWDYFSPSALSAMEWGHYFGLPAAICKLLFGRWILAPWRWNLWPTLALVRRYYNEPIPQDGGAYTFYSTRRAAGIALRSPGNNE